MAHKLRDLCFIVEEDGEFGNDHFGCQVITLITILATFEMINLILKIIHAMIFSSFTRIPVFYFM